jgi:hypothetical protein
MVEAIFTVDYEIYGNGAGALHELVYSPADRLRRIFEKWRVRLVNFVEVAELEKIDVFGADPAIDLVKRQIKELYCDGFELGLHLHPQWCNARYESGQWILDSSEYNLCTLPRMRISEIVQKSLAYLRDVVNAPRFAPLSLASVCSQIHNANFLAAALLGRAYSNTGDVKFLLPGLKVARCSADKQQANGSWYYGEKASQRWIDNFHSDYNLCALRNLSRHAATTEFDHVIRRGFEFYRLHFIGLNGTVQYFHNQLYPIDIHCVAQSIITLLTFNDMASDSLPLAHSVFNWTLAHMWDDRGFFYYRILRSHTNRISYMRWSQAWMLLAMAMLQGASASVQRGSSGRLAEVAPS